MTLSIISRGKNLPNPAPPENPTTCFLFFFLQLDAIQKYIGAGGGSAFFPLPSPAWSPHLPGSSCGDNGRPEGGRRGTKGTTEMRANFWEVWPLALITSPPPSSIAGSPLLSPTWGRTRGSGWPRLVSFLSVRPSVCPFLAVRACPSVLVH